MLNEETKVFCKEEKSDKSCNYFFTLNNPDISCEEYLNN